MPKRFSIVNEVMNAERQLVLGFSFDFSPSAVILVAEFAKLGLDIRSFKVPLHRAAKYMGSSFKFNFDAGGRPYTWTPLKETTIERKVAMGAKRPYDPLIRTGRLMKVAGQLNIWTINGMEGYAAVTNLQDAGYGIYHQRGVQGQLLGRLTKPELVGSKTQRLLGKRRTKQRTVAVATGTPQREFLVFQKQDEEIIDAIFIEWIQERTLAHGFKRSATSTVQSVKSFSEIGDLFPDMGGGSDAAD